MSEDGSGQNGQASVRVLLVEDDPESQYLLLELIRSTGAQLQVTTCSQLHEAVALAHDQPFDAALLDLGLPDSNGLDTFRRIHREHPELPIVIITGSESEATARAAIRDGATDYLYKSGLSGHTLLRSLRYVIGTDTDRSGDAQAEHLRAQQRALLRRLARSGTGGAAGRLLGTRPLQELSSELFGSIATRFGQIVDLQIDDHVFGIEHDTTGRLRDLAADLADAHAGPRDVVDVYAAALGDKEHDDDMTKDRIAAYADAARAAAFELMGYLVSSYRARVVPRIEEG